MFVDLVGSTALSEQLDPEEYREVIQAYRATCATVIRRFDGYLAKYIGDGLLVYFGYPTAHEDDARRAVRVGLEIVERLQSRARQQAGATPLPHGRGSDALPVRIGIHTGLVVAGEMGVGDQPEPLGIVGETPNIAARLQEKAVPNSVVISPATYRLVAGLFDCQNLGPQELKGLSTPLTVYRVVGESAMQSRFEVAVQTGLTPLVGRESELGLLKQRWEHATTGAGQVVLLSGEPGIGKSRLVQELKEQLAHEGATRIEFRCSPYHQNSALYPIIDHLQRLLQFAREDSSATKLEKLQHTLSRYRFPQADTAPLLAALLSLPHPEGYPPLTVSPQKQKEKTQGVLVVWLVEEAVQNTVFTTWEDVHWADPSTLEVLNLVIDQAPTARLYVLLTFRPEFSPPWGNHSHISQLTLNRLGRSEVEAMVALVAAGTPLPTEVVEQIRLKTDGVPLFVEELTKTVIESVGAQHAAPVPLAIPATLQDSLMARLDRLGPAKEIAQLSATLGREFSYELLHVVSPLDEAGLQQGLKQLVTAELLYQRGLEPQARYLFKHALIQDTAYQSLLKSRRQQLHQQIAHVLEERFPETKETQPEFLAHHYSEAGLIAQAIPYWQKAGQRAVQRSANVEAVAHLTKGLELLKTLPETPERISQELTLQLALGTPLMATKGWAAPEVGHVYARARALCKEMGETPQLFPVLCGLWVFYQVRGEFSIAHELGEQLLSLAQNVQDSGLLLMAHQVLGETLLREGELIAGREHLEQGIALYDPQRHHSLAFLYTGINPGVGCWSVASAFLWYLGCPDQALKSIQEALTQAHELSHPFSLGHTLAFAAGLHQLRREGRLAQEQAEAMRTLASEQELPFILAAGTIVRGWALAEQGREEEGMAQMRQGMDSGQAMGAQIERPWLLARLAETHGKLGQVAEGLQLLDEAIAVMLKTGQRNCEAELYRLQGELTLQSSVYRLGSSVTNPQAEAEAYFLKAIEVARKQQAKSLELRASTSLARLWQQQGKRAEARRMLADVYKWFTEGFDTKDLQEAKALMEELD